MPPPLAPQGVPLDLQRKPKRRRTELEDLGPPVPESELAVRGQTRSGRTRDALSKKKTRFSGRNTADYLYPSDRGAASGPSRKAMSSDITKGMRERAAADVTATSLSRHIVPLSADPFAPPTPELKSRGVARDHILADSRIRGLLSETYHGNSANAVDDGRKSAALTRFFTALAGEAQGADLSERFRNACRTRNADARDAVIHEAADGLVNLRFGNADINTVVSNEFDPVVIDGRLTEESMEIRDATIGLAEAGLVGIRTVSDALSVTKDRHTHEDVTSTVMRGATIAGQTGSRTVIDSFALPKDRRMFTRRNSLPPEDTGRPASRAMAPAREFHHSARQADDRSRSDLSSGSAMSDIDDAEAAGGQVMSDIHPMNLPSFNAMPDIGNETGASPLSAFHAEPANLDSDLAGRSARLGTSEAMWD